MDSIPMTNMDTSEDLTPMPLYFPPLPESPELVPRNSVHDRTLRRDFSLASESVSEERLAILQRYSTILELCLFEGKITPGEQQLLKDYKDKHQLTEKDHLNALASIGYNLDTYIEAIEKGEEELPDKKYGSCRYKTKYYSHAHQKGTQFCGGLIIAPHLRQWYERDKYGKAVYFVRDTKERSASWLELFFDLIFVTLINAMAKGLEGREEEDFYTSLGKFFIVYTAFWRIWMGLTLYSTRYERHDWLHPIIYFLTMFGAVAMGIQIDNIYQSDTSIYGDQFFSIAYIFASLPVLMMYIFATFTEYCRRDLVKQEKRLFTPHPLLMSLIYGCALIPWITVAILKSGFIIGWACSLFLTEAAELVANVMTHKDAPLCVEHWGERLALLVMIHLGESIFTIITNIPPGYIVVKLYWEPYATSAMGLLIAFSLRRVYFEIEDEHKEPHALRRNRIFALLWIWTHWILCLSIVTLSIGLHAVQNSVIENLEGTCSTRNTTTICTGEEYEFGKWLFSGSLSVTVFVIAVQSSLSVPAAEDMCCENLQFIRLGIRLMVALGIAILPIFEDLQAITLLVTVGILFFLWSITESLIVLPSTHITRRASVIWNYALSTREKEHY